MVLRHQIWSRAIAFSTSRPTCRFFSTPGPQREKNRIYTNVRTPDEFETLNLLSASSRKPLITLWTASWCKSCQTVKPILRSLIEDEGVGEAEGGLGYAEVELDSVLIGDLGVKYMISSMPTLLAFSRQEAQYETKVTKLEELKSREFLRSWLENEARRGGAGGGGGRGLLGFFGSR